jgi:pteridine reductase
VIDRPVPTDPPLRPARPRALVTGAARRVGAAIAVELARSGFDVVIHFHGSASEAEATAATCRGFGGDARLTRADLSSDDGCRELVAAVGTGPLDLLVNNASIFNPRPFADIDRAEWDRQLQVNLRSPFLLVQGLLGSLRAARGCVVQLVDIGAERPLSGYAAYSIAKAGAAMLVKAMAVELAPDVRAVGVSPGQVAWPDDYDAALREKLLRRIPQARVGTPEEVARVVRFAATEGTYLNGTIIEVDGGLSTRY